LAAPIQPGGDVEAAVRGLEDIRGAALLLIISLILIIVGLPLSLGLILAAIWGEIWPGAAGIGRLEHVVGAVLGAAAVFTILLLIGLILGLVAIFTKLIPGLGKLKQWRAEFSTAHALVEKGMAGGLILILAGVMAIIASAFALSLDGVIAGSALVLVGLILVVLIGGIGIILACFKLKDSINESMYLVAGILFILSLIISFTGILVPGSLVISEVLSLIGWILIYVAVPRSIASLRSIQPTPAQPVQIV